MEDSVQSKTLQSTYDPGYFNTLCNVQDRHFWFCARRRVVAAALAPMLSELPTGYRFLEVGCGSGGILAAMEKVCSGGVVVGMDLYAEGLRWARGKTTCALVQGDILLPPFHRVFDLVGMFDVLEHLPDDLAALRCARDMLRIGGRLVLTVPAHPALWSYFDEVSCHARRYEPNELANRLTQAGFCVEYMTPYMMCLYPFIWVRRWMKSKQKQRSREQDRAILLKELHIVPLLNGILKWILSREAHLVARRWKLPFGTSLLAIARTDVA